MTKATANFHTIDPATQRPVFFAIGDPVPDEIAATVGSHVIDEAPDPEVDDAGDADTDTGTDTGTDAGDSTGTADVTPSAPEDVDQVPTGNIAEILAWVDGDAEKAMAALTAEEASDNKPRTTLIDDLNQIIAAAAAADTSSGAAETPTEAGAE